MTPQMTPKKLLKVNLPKLDFGGKKVLLFRMQSRNITAKNRGDPLLAHRL